MTLFEEKNILNFIVKESPNFKVKFARKIYDSENRNKPVLKSLILGFEILVMLNINFNKIIAP